MRPGEAEPTRGKSFEENADTLDLLSRMLRDSAEMADADTFLSAAIAVVEWGGVRRNKARLNALGKTTLPTICAAAVQLGPKRADWARLDLVRDMNSGFSKIYALMLDGFPIYDSRVACALCSLIRAYCKESGLATVPPLLSLGLPPSQGRVQRNPSVRGLNFHQLWYGQRRKYAVSNLMAAWLLGSMAKLGPFAALPPQRRLLAVESALFKSATRRWNHKAVQLIIKLCDSAGPCVPPARSAEPMSLLFVRCLRVERYQECQPMRRLGTSGFSGGQYASANICSPPWELPASRSRARNPSG